MYYSAVLRAIKQIMYIVISFSRRAKRLGFNELVRFFGYEYGLINRAWYWDTQIVRGGPAWGDWVGECDGVAEADGPSVAQDLWGASLGWVQ